MHESSTDYKHVLEFDPASYTGLRRHRCSCGWVGCWYRTSEMLQRSFERHLEQVADLGPALFVGSLPAVDANGDPEAL